MVAPGFRSRIATGLLVASVVLPVPLGATSAVAADRRATPVDRPSNLARPDDQRDDYGRDDYATGDFGMDDYGADDLASGSSPADGRGTGRAHPGHSGASARAPGLPDRFPGLPYALPGFPHRPPHHHFGGHRGHGEWRHHHHHRFGPGFIGQVPPFGLPGPEGRGRDFPRRGHHGPPGPGGPPGADRGHSLPGRHSARKHSKPAGSASRAGAVPAGSSASHHHNVADRRGVRSYDVLPPLPTAAPKKDGSAPDGADGEATERPYAMETPAAPVERVLPMGAGLALTGLGLAFFALRLRRS